MLIEIMKIPMVLHQLDSLNNLILLHLHISLLDFEYFLKIILVL